MRKLILPTLLLLLQTAYSQAPKLYINFVSHNEPGDNLQQPMNFNRTVILVQQMADLMNTKGAKWNLETCDGFVDGALNIQSAGTSSNDIFQTLASAPYNDNIEIDPRNKNNTGRNIADLYHLLDSCGANPSHTLGGFIYFSSTSTPTDWFQYEDTIVGLSYPQSRWKCQMMWGAGSILPHTNDLNDYGIWKPDTVDNFYTHNSNRSVWYIGNGCQPIYALDSSENEQVVITLLRGIVDSLQNAYWPQNKFYNYSITFNQSQIGPMLLQKISNVIDSVNAWGTTKIEWKTLTEKFSAFQAWQNTPNDYSQWNCGDSMVLAIKPVLSDIPFRVYPNPSAGQATIELPEGQQGLTLEVYNALGQLQHRYQLNGQSRLDLNIEGSAGLYLLCLLNEKGEKRIEKWIKY